MRTRRPIRSATVWVAMAVTAVVVAVAGCGGGGEDRGPSASMEGRRQMPSCGSFFAPQSGELPPEARTTRDCFLTAFREGREAEVVITVNTIEGDPIITIYRVLGADDVEVFVDSSSDKFSAQKLVHQRCTSVAEEDGTLAVRGCTTLA
jgi:hypothetical protein